MSLYERVHGVRLCIDCHVHAAIADGARCAACTNELLRATRPAVLRQPTWLERARERPHGLARPLDRSAA